MPPRIVSYMVVVAMEEYASEAAKRCAEDVQSWLSQGWQPQGGMSVTMSKSGNVCTAVQAMIKEDVDA